MTNYIKEDGALDAVVMTGHDLMVSTERNVRTFSKDFKADCVFVGDGAATDGDTVYLPTLEHDGKVTKRQSLVIGGYALHETLHKLMTDFRWFKGKVKKWGPFTKGMHNAIEDVRIEHGGKDLYNGLPKQIDKTAREVNRMFIDEVYPNNPDIVKDFGRIGPVAVTWAGRKALGYADESNEEALALLPKDIRKRVERIANEAMKLGTGVKGMGDLDQREAFNGCKKGGVLAERITKQYIEELTEEQKKKPGDEQEGNKGEEEDGEGDGDGQSNQQGEGEEDGQGQGYDNGETNQDGTGSNGEKGEEGEGKEAGEGDGKEEGDGGTGDAGRGEEGFWGDNKWDGTEPEPYDPNLDVILKDTVADINKQGYQGYRVWAPNCDVTNTRHNNKGWSQASNKEFYQRSKDEAGPSLQTIRRKLERVLLENKQAYWQNGSRSGRLDVRRNAVKIVNYKPNVFRKREDERVVNSALSILIDQSGSMMGEKCRLAATTTIAICEALEPTNVPVEVLGHQMGEVPLRTEKERKVGRMNMAAEFGRGTVTVEPGYGRYNQLRMNVHKSFDDSLNQARGPLGRLRNTAAGGNADGDAIRFAAKRLLEREEPRKVLFVLSDGRPSWYSGTHCNQQWTRDCVQWCVENGIVIVGLGIQDDSVKKFFPHYIVVDDLEQFAKSYIDNIVKLLIGNGSKDKELLRTQVRRGSKL
jgi:cobalamin biosynthesis protein CobT